LIVDTGLHYYGFTRDTALEYFSKYAWDDTDVAKKEVKRTGFKEVLSSLLWRRGGLIVNVLDFGSSGPSSSPGSGHCVVFLGKTPNSHSTSLHPGV